MMFRPGSFIARAVALVILALVLVTGYQLIAGPLLESYWAKRDAIAHSTELLQRYRALAAEKPGLAERLAAVETKGDAGPGYLRGPSDALAAAELQNLAGDIIQRAGGDIRSTQILPATPVEEGPLLRRTGLKLRFGATIDSLATTLFELETIEPHLFIEQLLVSSQQARATPTADTATMLDVRLEIVGYLHEPE